MYNHSAREGSPSRPPRKIRRSSAHSGTSVRRCTSGLRLRSPLFDPVPEGGPGNVDLWWPAPRATGSGAPVSVISVTASLRESLAARALAIDAFFAFDDFAGMMADGVELRRTNISLPTATYCGWWLKYIRRPLEPVPRQFRHCTKVAVTKRLAP